MKESKLIGALMPSHPDILSILVEIHEKYQIPEISLEDDGCNTEILLAYE